MIKTLINWARAHWMAILFIIGFLFGDTFKHDRIPILAGLLGLGLAIGVAYLFVTLMTWLDNPLFENELEWYARALILAALLAISGLAYYSRQRWPWVVGAVEIGIGAGVGLHYAGLKHGSIIEALAAIFIVVDGIENYRKPRERKKATVAE